jgi:putative FmdB family regulatory protein
MRVLYLKQTLKVSKTFRVFDKIKGMPTYDFICLDCKKRFNIFTTYSEYGTKPAVCSYCGSENTRRRITRVRIAKSEESRLDSLGDFSDPSALEGLEDNPQELGRMMRKMGRELGEEMPAEFDEVVDRLEKGQSPEEIESALPDLGGDDGGGGFDGDL